MRMRTALISMAAAAALLAGCGSGDETGGAPPAAAGGTAGTGGAGGSLGGAGGSVGGTGGAGGSVGGSGGSVGGAGGSVGGSAGAEAGPDVAEAGPDDAEAAAGAGGTSGAGGAGGAAGTPFVDSCEGILDGSVIPPQKPLPYAVATDFKYPVNISPMDTTVGGINVLRWVNLGNPDCDMAFSDSSLPAPPPEFNVPVEAGTDGGGVPEAADDAGEAAADADDATADADDAAADAAADVGVDAVADVSVDAIADATADATADAVAAPACWGFYYNPDNCANSSDVDSGAAPLWKCYAGVIYAAAPSLAAAPGICIAAGATGIEFWARASREGAVVKFGSTREGLGLTEFWLTLTTTWTKYTIGVAPDYRTPGVGYGVSNGFSVVVQPADHVGGTYIFVKDMKWVGAANDGG
jgi:hypothetical protein